MGTVNEEPLVAEVRSLLERWDADQTYAGEFRSKIYDLFLDRFLKSMEDGEQWLSMSACCCSVEHPPARKMTVEFTLRAHGFSATREGPLQPASESV